MDEKAEFHGDVGQAVIGNVNEAPRLNNVVNLNVGGEVNKPLTKLQRRMITNKVKELVAIGGVQPLEIYRVLLSDFGADNMDKFPGQKYREAMDMLDAWIAELTDGVVVPQPAQEEINQEDPANMTTAFNAPLTELVARHDSDVKFFKRVIAGMGVAMVSLASALVWAAWPQTAEVPVSVETTCSMDGKAYSLGSTIRMHNGLFHECTKNLDKQAPYWSMKQRK